MFLFPDSSPWGPDEVLDSESYLVPTACSAWGGGITAVAPAGLQALERVEAGAAGGAGQGGRSRWHRGAWAQNQFWELGKSQGRRASIGRNQKLHVSVSVQRRWGSCECGGSMLKGLRPEPLNWKRQLPRDFGRLCSFREVCKGWYP